ncbi:MAG: LamG domain-containing protein [Sedimentisphaerales bacterium]|nr:LamG domain-containing protein [Sedimentisphaerales bacterium]
MYRKSILFVLVLSLVLTSVVKADLIGWWKFDDDFLDSSGLGNDGIPESNPTFVEGKVGSALQLSGSNYVVIDSVADDKTNNDITLCLWLKTSSNDAEIIGINSASRGNVMRLAIDSASLVIDVSEPQGHSTTPIDDGEWHFVTYVRNGSTGYIYVDGVQENSSPASFSFSDNDLWSIGQEWDSGGPSGFLIGIVDDVYVFDHALTDDEILVVMKGVGFPIASGANPADGSYIGDTWVNLSWRAGDFAVSHDVYFSDNLADVEANAEAAFLGNQASTFVVVGFPGMPYPDGLVSGTTYYWRVDEVNDADPNSPWVGNIWSFTVPPKTAYLPNPADGGESVDVNPTLKWTPGFGAKLHTVYFGESFDEVDTAAGGLPQGGATYSPGELKQAKTYYWRVDEFEVPTTHKGDVWSFTTEGAVEALSPVNGAVDVSQTPILTWASGLGASYDVYFGADAASLELKGSGNLGEESYEPGQLEWNTAYYWRVDEADSANADSPWTGPLWSFTTANFLIIDDMESYNDLDESDPASNRIYLAWVDGFGDPTNGSLVGYVNPPFAEQSIVHSGNQSMPLEYDNAGGKSEATLTLTSNKDWTVKGVDTLTIWYRGSNSNSAETMYVMLNGSANVDNGDPAATQASGWTEWNIPLQAFADQGVNLANVNSITLGLKSGSGGTGMIFVDDVRLYPPAE